MRIATASEVRVDVHYYADLFSRVGHKYVPLVLPAGECGRALGEIIALACVNVGLDRRTAAILVNGRPVRDDAPELMRAVVPGERLEIRVAPSPGTGVDLVLIAIAIISAVASAVLISNVSVPSTTGSGDPEQRRFGFSRFSNDAIAGDVIPVVFGRRERWGGKVISKVPVEGPDGDQRVRMLIALGHGPVNKIGVRTASWNKKGPADSGGIYLNDQPIANFPGCRTWGRMGTDTQTKIPGFDDVEVLREAGVGGVALVNTSGSERAGGSASGEAFSFTTLDPVDAVTLRVRMPRGLYSVASGGQINSRRVKWRYRYRVHAGPGAWSDWAVVTVDRADRSEVITAVRADHLGGETEPAPAPAVYDFQIERVSVDEPTATAVSDLLLDTLVEIRYADNNYPGIALLALELVASEQLTTIPRVSCEFEGYKGLRIWDGVSDPSSPAFSTGYSDNPADHALAWITNTRWGGGGQYTDSDVDFASLFEWRTYAEETVPRAVTGTRQRFACNLVIDQARPLDEWLRTICRTGRCTPQTSGRVWRFIVDQPRSAVEFFGDGDIAADKDGKAMFQYRRVSTGPASGLPNQLVAQFENAMAAGRNDVLKHPRDGELWLASEITNPKSYKVEGVTDPEQLQSQLIYELDKIRGLSRTVAFTTCRPAVVLQAGERFDLAMSLPGWGTSGRLAKGSTTTTVKLDRSVTLEMGETYVVDVTLSDGSRAVKTISSPAGDYPAGTAIGVSAAFAAAPGEFLPYALGKTGVHVKPFVATRVQPVLDDALGMVWRIEGIEYDANVYNEIPGDVDIPDYSDLDGIITPPGPLTSIRAYERLSIDPPLRTIELVWTQLPKDRQNTAHFRVYRRELGLSTWILTPTIVATLRGAVTELTDLDRAYQFIAVAVSQGGAALSPYDPRHPIANIVYGLSQPPPDEPDDPTETHIGNVYTLDWPDVEGAVGYQVLGGTDPGTGLPNDGAENAIVVGRPEESQITLTLPPGEVVTFWVRSVGASGRLSWHAGSITINPVVNPIGQTIKDTHTADFSAWTLDNLLWDDGSDGLLKLDNAADPDGGTATSNTIDTGALTLTELTIHPTAFNNAADPALNTDPFTVPSVAADQWGVVSGSGPTAVVGMLMPPWPDDEQTYLFEVQTSDDDVIYSDWGAIAIGEVLVRTFQYYRVRVTLKRAHPPYRPALTGLTVVTTN